MKRAFFILMLLSFSAKAGDTLVKHPHYPPLIYEGDDYRFYKYTVRYIPENMLHCFKILATCGDETLCRFMKKSEEKVVEEGMYKKGFRLRKEFCLEGYSSFTSVFHKRGIYYPHAMKTYILLSFHQYLNKERIRWHDNKRMSLAGKKEVNKAWKKRMKRILNPPKAEREMAPASPQDADHLDPIEKEFYSY
ncbi:hypothetical protein K6119_04585 [Paracrocinitomix mangrovi]|uniref:DUF6794 domain-containing protein n=1 Tax=Paracrocinitomix mangrovi TaxID=2862509 RepID=UPI001C8E290A|nr:DUF6794 domain-containing protein [Paracrocinitomix mangrovi]UKN02792.1 hypothetical protein K6119_04585 [Paracrocinitomix mangrovi]